MEINFLCDHLISRQYPLLGGLIQGTLSSVAKGVRHGQGLLFVRRRQQPSWRGRWLRCRTRKTSGVSKLENIVDIERHHTKGLGEDDVEAATIIDQRPYHTRTTHDGVEDNGYRPGLGKICHWSSLEKVIGVSDHLIGSQTVGLMARSPVPPSYGSAWSLCRGCLRR